MNTIEIGNFIRNRRKDLNLSQNELASKINISFQAVSKWETGVSLPDTSILLPLSEILNVSVDRILLAGVNQGRKSGIKISKIIEGFEHLEKLAECFGEHSTFYTGAMNGIDDSMNNDTGSFQNLLNDPSKRDILYTEAILQYIVEGYKVDYIEAEQYIKNSVMLNHIKNYIEKYNSN